MRAPLICTWMFLLIASGMARGESGVEYLRRLSDLNRDDPQAVAALADWARRRNLKPQAAELYHRIVELRPEDERAYEQLVKLRATTRLPENEARRKRLLADFEGFSLHVAPHFLVVYDTKKAWALNRAVLLEKTHDTFYATLRRADLRPMPLERRLVCVLFDEHEDFVAYARRADGADMAWSSGYYSSGTNRIAFFNDRTNPVFNQVTQRMAALRGRLDELENRMRDANRHRSNALLATYRRERTQLQRRFNWYRTRRDAIAGLGNTMKTTHEAVHQLAFNSGLQARGSAYPFWLSEGLAMSFETTDASEAFGPYHPNAHRRGELLAARREDRLIPLEQLVGIGRSTSDDAERAAALYAQAWGLFHFLFTRRHEQMRAYLSALSEVPPGARDETALREAFEEAFGAIGELREQWVHHLRQLR